MAEKGEFLRLLRQWQPAAVPLVTFGVTLLKDLAFGIVGGCLLAAAFVLFGRRIAEEGD
jgi:sulfate permease, SulP family